VVCLAGDGIGGYGAWTTAAGSEDQITAAAAYPGGTGKGFRHWRGPGGNNNGGGVSIEWPTPQKEIWIRWYMRYEAGFSFEALNYTKDLYVNVGGPNPVYTMGFHWADQWGVAAVNPVGGAYYGDVGWQSLMPGGQSDGAWHCYEAHTKVDTNGADGIAESWIDGALMHSHVNVDWGTAGDWVHMTVGENQATVDNGGADMYTDFDEIVVSATGYIGCLGATSSSSSSSGAGGAGGSGSGAGGNGSATGASAASGEEATAGPTGSGTGASAASEAEPSSPRDDSGCACSAPGVRVRAGAGALVALALALLGGLARLRRREDAW